MYVDELNLQLPPSMVRPLPYLQLPTVAPPAPPLVASIMGAAVVDDGPSQSPSPSPSPPPEDAPDDVDIPEREDIEAEVEDEAADAETEADLQHEYRAEALTRFQPSNSSLPFCLALARRLLRVEIIELGEG